MASFNKVFLIGNLTRDPELRYTQNSKAVASLGLAVNNARSENDVTFVDLTVWDKQAEVAAQYLKKGSMVHVEGRLKLESWEKDGQKRSKLVVVVENFQFLDRKNGASSNEETKEPVTVGTDNGEPKTGGDIPF